MFLAFLLFFSKETKKICICNNECHILCPSNRFQVESNSSFAEYINSEAINEQQIELFFYSKREEFIFSMDLTPLRKVKFSMQTMEHSQVITLKIKQETSKHNTIIQLKPNYKIILPDLLPFHINDKHANILEEQTSTIPKSIPISVGINQMKFEGRFMCQINGVEESFELTNSIDSQNVNCEYNN